MARWIRKYNNRDRERLERLIEEKEAEASHHLRSEHNGSANATQQLWKSLRIETNDRKYLDSVHDRSSRRPLYTDDEEEEEIDTDKIIRKKIGNRSNV